MYNIAININTIYRLVYKLFKNSEQSSKVTLLNCLFWDRQSQTQKIFSLLLYKTKKSNKSPQKSQIMKLELWTFFTLTINHYK